MPMRSGFISIFAKIALGLLIIVLYYGCRAPELDLSIELPGGVALKLVYIPAGSFMMGSTDITTDDPALDWSNCHWGLNRCDLPIHLVTFPHPFLIGAYEVTQEQWQAVMGNNPSGANNINPTCPVDSISWYDALAFTAALSRYTGAKVRLPTEAEWEYAVRAGTTTRFFFGDSDCQPEVNASCELDDYAWWGHNNPGGSSIVGQKLPNPWELYDIYGNVHEWCLDDWHSDYSGAPSDGSAWRDGNSYKVLRGNWRDVSTPRSYCSAARTRINVDQVHVSIGLRIVAEISE